MWLFHILSESNKGERSLGRINQSTVRPESVSQWACSYFLCTFISFALHTLAWVNPIPYPILFFLSTLPVSIPFFLRTYQQYTLSFLFLNCFIFPSSLLFNSCMLLLFYRIDLANSSFTWTTTTNNQSTSSSLIFSFTTFIIIFFSSSFTNLIISSFSLFNRPTFQSSLLLYRKLSHFASFDSSPSTNSIKWPSF